MLNRLFYGDNLDVLRKHITTESVDLIYLDPPFNSNRSYNVLFKHKTGKEAQAQIEAFDDTWTWSQEAEQEYLAMIAGQVPAKVADALVAMRGLLGDNDVLAYLVMMTSRLVELRRVLSPTGTLYLHCDPTASHYLKVMLDALFGPRNFRNEIIWAYRGGGVPKHDFAKRHDVIFRYSRSKQYAFNVDDVRLPYSADSAARLRYKAKAFRGERVYENYEQNEKGKHPEDWWELQPIMPSAKERLGYPTQKPERLLERIVLASSSPGDLVLDPFCGCGTTVAVANRLQRRWVGIDITYLAVDLIDKRLRHSHGDAVADTYEIVGIPRDVAGARALFQRNPFDFERWAVSLVGAQPNSKQVGDKGIDGVARFATDNRGGTDRILVSVKGGRSLNPAMVRDLIGTVDGQRAAMGVLITLDEPTKGMVEAANRSGIYTLHANGGTFPKAQIITVAQLLAGQRLKAPPTIRPYTEAQRHEVSDNQLTFGGRE